ncbi:putative beta gamma crystallin [Diplodia seriata]|uniref:Putative beta gamma crystallin n=1 Tax=Diplodia seriata TaxID=420778 RepID=A0A0G2FXE3_9PEZI|nr:putative beta gamma crystallin [Diplodia seriata]
MQLTNILLLTLSAVALSLAAPQPVGDRPPSLSPVAIPSESALAHPVQGGPDESANLEARSSRPVRIRYCQHANGAGACENWDVDLKRCYNFMGWWDNRVSSVYVNPGYKCWLYDGKGCEGLRKEEVKMPGILDLKKKFLNDKASSVYCFR